MRFGQILARSAGLGPNSKRLAHSLGSLGEEVALAEAFMAA